MNKRRMLIIPIVLGLVVVATAASCTPRDLAVNDCLTNTNRPAVITPTPADIGNSLTVADNTTFDARGATYKDWTFSLKLRNHATQTRSGVCLVGGTYTSKYDPVITSWDPYWHGSYGVIVQTPNALVTGATVRNVGDAVAFEHADTENWAVVGVRADGGGLYPNAYIHDDCIQNDAFSSGKVSDSKFDGCATFLSARADPPSNNNSSMNTVVVELSMVRVASMPGTYTNNGQFTNGEHGGFFKWSATGAQTPVDDGQPPKLVLRNSMFRSDERAYFGGNEGGFLGLPDDTVCDNVVVIGWDSWQQRDRDSWIEWCGAPGVADVDNPRHQGPADDTPDLRIGTVADWDTAAAAWDAAHPALVP